MILCLSYSFKSNTVPSLLDYNKFEKLNDYGEYPIDFLFVFGRVFYNTPPSIKYGDYK